MKVVVLLVLIVLTLGFSSSGQNVVSPNRFVRAVYSPEQIAQIADYRVEYLNFISENAWKIVDIPSEKMENLSQYPFLKKIDRITEITLDEVMCVSDIDDFNLLMFDFDILQTPSYYRISGSDKILIVNSQDQITREFNVYKNK